MVFHHDYAKTHVSLATQQMLRDAVGASALRRAGGRRTRARRLNESSRPLRISTSAERVFPVDIIAISRLLLNRGPGTRQISARLLRDYARRDSRGRRVPPFDELALVHRLVWEWLSLYISISDLQTSKCFIHGQPPTPAVVACRRRWEPAHTRAETIEVQKTAVGISAI
ncbi:hypothetical protein EVAR_21185_1 [Eumeta japonica]|uniref:Uncharacterized protein n=1 Tax=Eumeta variegata TaxID=151549 RepID=A0A4C1UNQ0_EUMVA|nr:hypothetical protein EVAR_21185_1 [Eumeta japonica]